jgi:L-lactate dehydrogenase
MKVGIIGAGNVGIGVLDSLVYLGVAKEVILFNRTLQKAEGEIFDLEDSLPFLNDMKLGATNNYNDLKGCKVVVITAGVKQKVGQTRLELLNQNVSIVKSIIKNLDEVNLTTKIIIVTNPVDILTRIAKEVTKRDKNLIFGSGTVLDSIRLQEAISKEIGVNTKDIHAYVIGEHGDSEFVLWSMAMAGCVEIDKIKQIDKKTIENRVRKRAYKIIEKKGFTKQAIGVAVATIIKAILNDEKRIFTISTILNSKCFESKVSISQPCILGKNGIERKLLIECDNKEKELLRNSINKLDEVYQSIK